MGAPPQAFSEREWARPLRKLSARPSGGTHRAKVAPTGDEVCDSVYVWVDFGSIAQQHRGMQVPATSPLPRGSSLW